LNNSYYETLDENFTQALKLYEGEYTHEKLLHLLQTGNIVQKQIAALRLDCIMSNAEADILTDNLTGQDGKIREAVSLRLSEFMSYGDMIKYFSGSRFSDVFLKAVIDINANICRNVINAIKNLKKDEEFCASFCSGLTDMTFELLEKVEKFDFKESGRYKINKELFKLYWCLETVYEFYDRLKFSDLKQIILRSKNIPEYTIREKTAKILTRGFSDIELKAVQNQLKSDENYYVRSLMEKL